MMLDVHPPHHAVSSWKDFFIHIATIVIGLCIAVGLEQTVEAIHHRHQRNELTEQMRVEAEHNLPIIRESLSRLVVQRVYLGSLLHALASGAVSGDTVSVASVIPQGGAGHFVSPSRAAWAVAQAAGLVSLLSPGQAKLYARLDFNAGAVTVAEEALYDQLDVLLAECRRAGYNHAATGTSSITIAHRDNLVFQLAQVNNKMDSFIETLSLMQGADESVVAGALSLEEMYSYQSAAMGKLPMSDGIDSFYGGHTAATYEGLATHSAPPSPVTLEPR